MVKIPNVNRYLGIIAFSLGIALFNVTTSAFGQPAPALRAVVSADAAPESMSGMFTDLEAGQKTISLPGATWMQLQFSTVRLGSEGVLTITDASGEHQKFSQAQIDAWGGLTAVFNGSELRISLEPGEGEKEPVSATIEDIIIGLPPSTVRDTEFVTPHSLHNLLGPDIKRFIPEDVRKFLKEGMLQPESMNAEAICGATDDRVASTNPRVGRIMPIGCTGLLIEGGNLLTAGHCINANTQTVEFNVPASQANGATVAPPIRDQYRVIAGTIVSQNTGVGNDWAVFQVLPNTQTGLMPAAAQGATFQLSNTDNPAQVRITGYGVDGPAPNFGSGTAPRNAQNQTQQTHVGTLTQNTSGSNAGVLQYNPDTQGGNSGSPVIIEGTDTAIGIHTNGGCTPTGGTNAGTSFRNAALWRAVVTAQDRAVTCTVFGDGYSNQSNPSDAIYFAGNSAACTPDGTSRGNCRKWFGRCATVVPSPQSVNFRVFNDGDSNQTAPVDAVYNRAQNVSCIPDGSATGNCRRWFGLAESSNGRRVQCYLFNDGYENMIGPTHAIYYRIPGSVCMPDGTSMGACRKWFGRCELQ